MQQVVHRVVRLVVHLAVTQKFALRNLEFNKSGPLKIKLA